MNASAPTNFGANAAESSTSRRQQPLLSAMDCDAPPPNVSLPTSSSALSRKRPREMALCDPRNRAAGGQSRTVINNNSSSSSNVAPAPLSAAPLSSRQTSYYDYGMGYSKWDGFGFDACLIECLYIFIDFLSSIFIFFIEWTLDLQISEHTITKYDAKGKRRGLFETNTEKMINMCWVFHNITFIIIVLCTIKLTGHQVQITQNVVKIAFSSLNLIQKPKFLNNPIPKS